MSYINILIYFLYLIPELPFPECFLHSVLKLNVEVDARYPTNLRTKGRKQSGISLRSFPNSILFKRRFGFFLLELNFSLHLLCVSETRSFNLHVDASTFAPEILSLSSKSVELLR